MNDGAPRLRLRIRLTGPSRALLSFALPGVLWTWLGAGPFGGAAAALAVALVATAAAWAWLHARGLRVRGPSGAEVTARAAWVADVEVTQTSRFFGARDLALRMTGPDRVSAPRGATVARIGPRATAAVEVRCPPLRRGVHPLGVLELTTSAPVGLVEARIEATCDGQVVALPRTGRLRLRRSTRELRRKLTAGAGRRGAPEGDVDSLREWRPGESLRAAHWRHSARRGRVLLREFRSDALRPIHVVLRTDIGGRANGASPAFEEAVTLAATLVDRHLRDGRQVRLTIGGHGTSVRCRPGPRATAPALHALARCDLRPGSAAPAIPPSRDETFAVVRVEPGGELPRGRGQAPARCVLEIDGVAVPSGLDRADAAAPSRAPGGAGDEAARSFRRPLACVAAVSVALGLWLLWSAIRGAGADDLFAGGVVVAAAGAVLWGARKRPGRADLARVLWVAPFAAIGTFTSGAQSAGAAALPVAVLLLLAGLGLDSAWAAATPAPLPAARRRRGLPESRPPAATPLRSAFAGAALSPAAILLCLLLASLFEAPVGTAFGSKRQSGGEGADRSGPAAFVIGARPTDPRSLDSEDETILLIDVAVSRGGTRTRSPAPLYMRGAVHSDLDRDGNWTTSAGGLRPLGATFTIDGNPNIWRSVGDVPTGPGAYLLDVEQVRIEHDATGLGVLHAPASTTAVSAPAPHVTEDGMLLTDSRRLAAFSYALVVPPPAAAPSATDRTRARRPFLPLGVADRHPAFAALRDEARDATRRSTTDLARVKSVLERLRTTRTYERTGESLPGPAGLAAFIRDGRGTCVQFAEAGALMLRSIGVPARVVHGFLLSRIDPVTKTYRGFARNYHAWIEVEFEGVGWVPFDGTPAAEDAEEDARNAASAADEDPAERTRFLDVAAWLAARPWLFAISALVLPVAFLLARALLRRRAFRSDAGSAGGAAPDADWSRIVELLAALGLRRAPSETMCEFAGRAAARIASGTELLRLAARQQEARFGGRALAESDRASIRALAASI